MEASDKIKATKRLQIGNRNLVALVQLCIAVWRLSCNGSRLELLFRSLTESENFKFVLAARAVNNWNPVIKSAVSAASLGTLRWQPP